MEYTKRYTSDDLFDMFANDSDADMLVFQPTEQVANDLKELAPDMADSYDVAISIQKTAASQRLHANT